MSSSIIIELYNGVSFVRVNGRVDGTDNFTVTLRRKEENGGIARSFSSELTFYDDGYQILKSALIDPSTGFNNEVAVKIYDSCCNKLVFEGIIYGTKIDWCEPKCSITVHIVEREITYNCIQTKLIYDDTYGFLSKARPKLKYCLEHRPIFIHVLLIAFGFIIDLIIKFILDLVFLLVSVVFLVLYSVCIIAHTLDLSFNYSECQKWSIRDLWEDVKSWKEDVDAAFIPCGNYHPTAYVRDYIDNVCKICGLNFKSSILNDPAGRIGSIYYGLGLFSALVKKGRKSNDTDATLIADNLPIETLETLFENYLKPIFNADYQIIGNDLVFERKDYFYNTVQWIDTETLLNVGRIENDEICYNWIDRDRPAYGVYNYTPDAQEYIGNEAITRYKDIVEWNSPYSPAQKGDYKLTIGASPIRTMFDNVDDNVYQAFGQKVFQYYSGQWWTQLDITLLAQHTAFNYKFIILEENGSDAFVKNKYDDSFIHINSIPYPGTSAIQRANYPMWFKEGIDQVSGYQNNLYSLFHYIDNPRLASSVQYQFKFTFKFDCDDYNSFDYYKTVRLIRGGQVRFGKIEEITVDFTKRTMQVTGKVN